MKQLRCAGILSMALMACGTVVAQGDSPKEVESTAAAKLVDDIAMKPAIYNQACSMVRPRDPGLDLMVNFSGRSSDSDLEISAEQFLELRKKRPEVLKVLDAWLVDIAKPYEDDISDFANPRRGKLLMLVDLNGASCLPVLKRECERLLKIYGGSGPETRVDWAEVDRMDEAAKKRIYAKADSRDRAGDLLSAIVSILRQEKFAPLIASKFEKDAEAQIAAQRKETWCVEVEERIRKNGGKVEQKDRSVIVVDPVIGDAFPAWAYSPIKISAESVAEILKWVDEFAKLPEENRLGEKGMLAWPVNR